MKSLSQMTEKELKTLCKSLESRYGENSTVTIKQSDFNKMWASIDRYAKENKCLQKQLAIATKALKRILNERDERAVGDYLWIANNALKEMEGVK